MRGLTQDWVGAYRDFFSPFAYFQEGMRTLQRATQQSLEAAERVARHGLGASEEATRQGLRVAERTEDVLRQTEKATREAELRTAVLGALKTANYDELSIVEVTRRVEGLPTEQLKKVRELEKNHKNRETLIEQIDRKIRANENS